MKFRFIRSGMIVAVSMLGGASIVAAETITYTIYSADLFSPSGTQQSIDQSSGFFPLTVQLPRFDTTAGFGDTLISVELKLDYASTGEIKILNFNSTDQPHSGATITVPLTVTADLGSGSPDPITGTASASIGSSATTTPTVSYTPPGPNAVPGTYGQKIPKAQSSNPSSFGYVIYSGLTSTGTLTSGLLTASNILAAFSSAGASIFDVTVNADDPTFSHKVTPLVFFGGSATVGGKISVTYTYINNVPEPMTMVLMGSAVLGLGILMRRRRNNV